MPTRADGSRLGLLLLQLDVWDESFRDILMGMSRLIRGSEERYVAASHSGNPDREQSVGEIEAAYIEELIGYVFLVLQAKIRRVGAAAASLHAAVTRELQVDIDEFRDMHRPRTMGEPFQGTNITCIELIWAVANYFKHRDEWPHEAWTDEPVKGLNGPRATRKLVETLGLTEISTGNMRCALEAFGIDLYSNLDPLADAVQAWAGRVLAHADKALDGRIAPRRASW